LHLTVIGLRIVHVLSAMFWVGTALFNAFFLFPAMTASGPNAGPVMAALQKRGMLVVLPLAAVLTILSGFTLFWILSGGALGAFASTRVGGTFATAGAFAFVAFVFGMLVARPSAIAAGRLAREAGGVSDPAQRASLQQRVGAMQRRASWSNTVVMVLVVAAAIGMAVARYV
jgi:uncharacterized membrane protein